MVAPLTHWLRLLWDITPQLHLGSDVPFIAGGAIHLPACSEWLGQRAAAAHAAAHLVHSPTRFDAGGLAPIARALLALLEDARVEALAGRDLPGLKRLWQSRHDATPDAGTGFEALMRRLARALADPGYDDPHPWVRKGVALLYLDAAAQTPALHTPAELRRAATLLGHDIGQMRLPFNAKTYRPAPNYRDDHRWMWPADVLRAAAPPAILPDTAAHRNEPEPVAFEVRTRHPEWDRLIGRLRRDWCTVVERQAGASHGPAVPIDRIVLEVGRRLRSPLRRLAGPSLRRRRVQDGDAPDIDAVVDWRVAQRLALPIEARIYRSPARATAQASVWLLIDRSASSAAAHAAGGTLLRAAAQAAAATARALQMLGVACSVCAFHSNGRHVVQLQTLKGFDMPTDAVLDARLHALCSEGSTRLGAVLRHATMALAARWHGPRWVLLLWDGEPHDVDVHDPRYLVEDARQAVRAAARRAVHVASITLSPGAHDIARHIFGAHRAATVQDLGVLPRALRRLIV